MDVIEKLLQSTGLSCDDLLSKLQQYKSVQANKSSSTEGNCSLISNSPAKEENGNDVEKTPTTINADNSVILETKSSTVESNCEVSQAETQSEVKTCPNNGHVLTDFVVKIDEVVENCSEKSICQNSEDSLECQKSRTQVEETCHTVGDVNENTKTVNAESIDLTIKINEAVENSEDSLDYQKDKTHAEEICHKVSDVNEHPKAVNAESIDSTIKINEAVENSEDSLDYQKDKSHTEEICHRVSDVNERPKAVHAESIDSTIKINEVVEKSEDSLDYQKDKTQTEELCHRVIDVNEHPKAVNAESIDLAIKMNDVVEDSCDKNICQISEDILDCQKNETKIEEMCYTVSDVNENTKTVNLESVENIEIPSAVDHSYSSSKSNDSEHEISTSSADDLTKSEDSLRNTIRMQLSSLRNMKKSSGYLPDLDTKRSMFFHNLKKKRKSCDLNPLTRLDIDDKNEDENQADEKNHENKDKEKNDEHKDDEKNNENKDDEKNNEHKGDEKNINVEDSKVVETNDDSLVSLADETQFVILDVTGGVDRLTSKRENEKSKSVENEERRFAAISETSDTVSTNFDVTNKLSKDIQPCQDKTKISKSPRKEIKNILTNYRRKMCLNYFDESCYNFTSPRMEDKPRSLTIRKKLSDSFNEDPGINKSVKNSEKSPFVSDSLEDFLNESSQLKISYAIPKLGAEEGICESTKKCPFDDVVGKTTVKVDNNEQEAPQKEKTKLIKAKTLAEMRRHFEKMKAKNKTVDSKEKIKANKENVIVGPNIAPHRNSFVIYNKKKTWVPSKFKNKCVAVIDGPRKDVKEVTPTQGKTIQIEQTTSKKPSLLSTLTQNKPCKIKYKPGPLCKKAHLQNMESRDKWMTEVRTLPKIYLEVVPEVSRPLHPKLYHLLPIFNDTVITEERTNFALSVLKPKNETVKSKSFKFHVPYNNKQEKMVVRKRAQPVISKPDVDLSQNDPTAEISNVLNDIITYVEIKEIEDTLIKEDDTVVHKQDDKVFDGNPKVRARKIRRNKLDLELLRLNCKVIDVATNATENEECTKPFCKMGCICKSLLCDSVFSNHCQLVECMFECKCPSAPENETMTANNSLSAHTVNHLDDKAKKNLAKIEREFTQTLIHTDNDVILVGTGGRNKMRRTAKAPKKYTDYVGDIDEIFDTARPSKPVQVKEKEKVKKCLVDVPKLNLDNVIPYCLYHNMYNCFCKGEMVDSPAKTNTTNVIPKIRIVKTKEDQNKSWYNSCARIRKIFDEYKVRNKDPIYNHKLRAKNDSNKLEVMRKFVKIEEQKAIESNNEPTVVGNAETTKKVNKRKQSFNVREEVVPKNSENNVEVTTKSNVVERQYEYALQRRKKKPKLMTEVKVSPKYYPIFEGEIRVSLKDNKEMLRIIGEENSFLEYLRILPWRKVIEGFRLRKINIWSRERRPSALLCNAAGYFPPKYFVDIRKVVKKTEIINWILTDNLPADRPKDLMHLILTPKKTHFLISGYCLKKVESDESDQLVERPSDDQIDVENLSIEITEAVQSVASFKSPELDISLVEQVTDSNPDPLDLSTEQVPSDEGPKSVESRTDLSPKLVEFSSTIEEVQGASSSKLIQFRGPHRRKKSSVMMKLKQLSRNIGQAPGLKPTQRSKIPKPALTSSDAESTPPKIIESCDLPSTNIEQEQVAASSESIQIGHDQVQLNQSSANCEHVSSSSSPEPIQPRKKLKQTPTASDHRSIQSSLRETEVISSPEITQSKTSIKQTISSSEQIKSSTGQHKLIPSRSLKCTHKDMFNKSKTLVLTNKEFISRKLYIIPTQTDKGFEMSKEILAPLPRVAKKFRWRMIYLNSDFSFLSFVKANYSVKYTDLMDVVKMSNNTKSTITLRNKEFTDQYKHPIFGIFCVPDHQDRLFIGPYSPGEKHNTETLRYLQGRLIDTQIFNKMVGKKVDQKSPLWLYETPSKPVSLLDGIVIDITQDDDDVSIEDVIEVMDTTTTDCVVESLLCPPFVEELSSELIKSKKINRYIITNIPHLGYFSAYQRDTKAIDVFWPGDVKGYRFPNVTFAKNSLIQYLSQIFCPVPQDFKINVVIMTHLDVKTNTPVDSKYFSQTGPYICGDFGIYDKDTVPKDLLQRYEVASIESFTTLDQLTQENNDKMIRLFGLFLMSNEELRKHSEPKDILQWATSEIYVLKKLEENYQSEKADLKNIIRANSLKVKKRKKKNKGDVTIKVVETIEIKDSDEEEERTEKTKAANPPVFKKICTSGKIQTGSRAIYNKNEVRSVLKPKYQLATGRSLLKINDTERQRFNLFPPNEQTGSLSPIKLSINSSNNALFNPNKGAVLTKNASKLTKLKPSST